ncbi:MAG: preprotein translocase subunit SecY [Chloroflexota bacterium]|nr:preprotein translocase subunit SecY [Chloroflexota bacterium]
MPQQQKSSMPRLMRAMIDAFRLPDVRRKLLFTLAMLVVFRFVAHVPIAAVDAGALDELVSGRQQLPALLGMLDIFSGGALRNVSIAMMGVYPYITASIIMQLMIPVIPRLQALQQEGDEGRRKLNRYTHWLMVPMCLLQGYSQMVILGRTTVDVGGVQTPLVGSVGFSGELLLPTVSMLLSLTAGTVFLVWIGERITENGIGNGISIIIFGGIVSALPANMWRSYLSGTTPVEGIFILLKLVILMLAIAFFIVFINEGVRRIPVQYSRSLFRGGRMYRQSGGTHIPLRVNSAGMIPLIFAYAILMLPATIASYVGAVFVQDLFGVDGYLYWIMLFLLVVGFTFFYTMVVFQQQNLAETLQRQGGFVPGIRPGRPTAEYLNKVVTRITWGGALFLALVAVVPLLSRWLVGGEGTTTLMLISSAGLLIVVGVVLDTMRQLEAQLLMRQYEGFIK